MTREDVLRMVRESGMTFILGQPHQKVLEQLTRFAGLVAERERKACKKLCDDAAQEWQNVAWSRSATEAHAIRGVSDAIRARGSDAA